MIKKTLLASLSLFMLSLLLLVACVPSEIGPTSPTGDNELITLPEPRYESEVSVEEALLNRRSVRDYSGESLTLQELAQLVWAAQGITGPSGKRTAPSAVALYPIELYVVVGNVEDVADGIYKYWPHTHQLERVVDGDKRGRLALAAMGQAHVNNGAIDIVICANYERTTSKLGSESIKFVHMEAGHVSQNVYLQVEALGLATVTIGGFFDDLVKEVLNLPDDEDPLYIMPVGRERGD